MNDATSRPRRSRLRRFVMRAIGALAAVLVVSLIAFTSIGGWAMIRKPSEEFDVARVPPPPDYANDAAWLAFPGRNGPERSTPRGLTAVDEANAPADVFFVHPTTFKGNPVWVAPFDASDEAAPLNGAVLLGQITVFNGCCRAYAPRYRQATLAGLRKGDVVETPYSDVARAFRYYMEHYNKGRPFILASHSQGTAHAIRLVQDEILNKPAIKSQMVAAYLIGGYVPDTFGELGLPICDSAGQIGCVISYNTSQEGRSGARMIADDRVYWWRGKREEQGKSNAVCVNPLTWRQQDPAPANANAGSLPFPKAPWPAKAIAMPPLVKNLTGAACRKNLLEVDIPWSAPSGFIDKLSILLGSYHINDYGIFYDALRRNTADRVAAWQKAKATAETPAK